jgi:hypothetical protein
VPVVAQSEKPWATRLLARVSSSVAGPAAEAHVAEETEKNSRN